MPEVYADTPTRRRGRSLARSRPPVALMSDEQLERRYDRVEVLLAALRQRGDSAARAGETTWALSATIRELVIERAALRQEIADR